MLDLRDGEEVDDIDHLGNRRVRSVGELVKINSELATNKRMVKEKMSLLKSSLQCLKI